MSPKLTGRIVAAAQPNDVVIPMVETAWKSSLGTRLGPRLCGEAEAPTSAAML